MYLARLPHVVVREIPASRSKDPAKQMEEESQRLLSALEKGRGTVWVLDERGKELSSRGLSEQLGALRDRGEVLTLVIGGAYGLNDAVRSRSDRLLALSLMTLPHELCRLLLLEQLFRSETLLKGTGYHH
jgi:23S rRNA (pseudouridine1915-N3)-methyltransferase